ncbi:tetratricopeptide (TPR) repeat protein [Paenibacillus sp. JGP012]|uniref:DUF2726 domain-containing protein n=1 Tax=Paenibacillus sp. JGP012 TaxID=2735914 RepID=UPI001613DBCB|nr:DUF2726 domain-containing protein [Paenibacillus sp. JGP012]MBB6023586.1 tetratricopeptide (TPR) repeat protein [Paenibacillus sp. JGP012]
MIEANTPEELLQLLQAQKREDFENNAEYEAYIDSFYTLENILTRVNYVLQNGKEAFENNSNQELRFNFLMVYYMKFGFIKVKEYKRAYETFGVFVEKEINWYLEDERSSKGNFDYTSNLFFIALQLICEYKHTGTVSDPLLKMWTVISPEELVNILIFPSYSNPDCLPSNLEFIETYIEVIRIMMEKKIKKSLLVRHSVSCVKLIYDEIQYSIINDHSSYLEQFNKLEVLAEGLLPKEIFELYRFLIDFQIESTNDPELTFYDKVSNDEIEFLNRVSKKAFIWGEKNKKFTPAKDYFDLLEHVDDSEKIDLIANCIECLLFIKDTSFRSNFEITNSLVEVLFDHKKYDLLSELYLKGIVDSERKWFEIAFSLKEHQHTDIAKKVYLEGIEMGDNSSVIYNNIGVILEEDEKNYMGALEYYRHANKLEPDDELIQKNINRVEKQLKQEKQRLGILKDTYFKKINKYHRNLLFTIYKLQPNEHITIDELIQASKQSETFVRNNINKLIELKLIKENGNGAYSIETVIEELIADYVDPKLERQIIKVDNSTLYRPIFYHESEITMYKVLIELFPQHFVFPNISLKTIFEVDKIREFITNEQLNYLFMAHVDFAVISTSMYTPIIAFEKDSVYHDNMTVRSRDEWKNLIFQLGGIPLIRIRFNNSIPAETLKHQIRDATKELILELKQDETNNRFINEVDFKKFGLLTNTKYDFKKVELTWNKVVGKGIAQKSKVDDFVDDDLLISISEELYSIVEMSKDRIFEELKKEFPQLDRIIYEYY